ncbi:cytochrome-c peroxidase [Campylobacter troglodytis]|uniref:cytochrome-c peroxidase n=1 Tax=Campylobacter troglodytis TaxID=654363 RepID=UPI0011597193|nr:cytochrome c peroxidase [Campylobacter troglodytis]
MQKSTKILSMLLALSLMLCGGLLYKVLSPKETSLEYPQNAKYRELYAKPVNEWAKPDIDESVLLEWEEFAPLSEPNFPKDNAYSDIKAFLGLRLFNEPKLSKSGQIACQNCHHPELAFTDALRLSYGHDRQRGRRNSPNIQAAAFFDELFWDGRAKGLEAQALGPITDPVEMANTLENAENSIKNSALYYPLFVAAFADEATQSLWARHFPQLYEKDEKKRLRAFLNNAVEINATKIDALSNDEINAVRELITISNIAKAIATYERSFVVPKNSRFNAFLKGDYRFMSDKELWGLDIFRNKGKCMNCHYGAIMSDKKFHNIGLTFYGRALQDLGRYEVTQNPEDVGKFKTPSLLGVSKSAPYMHTGTFPNLTGVLNMYNAGFPVSVPKGKENDPLLPKTDPLIKRLDLTREEISALEAFLRVL